MLLKRKHGFTLVELLVVISILGILAAALVSQVSRARELGKAIKCKANLKNLSTAAMTYGLGANTMPWAGSQEISYFDRDAMRRLWAERKGWISWYKGGSWPADSSRPGTPVYFSEDDDEKGFYALTNGVLWEYVGKDMATYLCDVHVTVSKRNGVRRPRWSYVMNNYFGYKNRDGAVSLNDLSAGGSSDRRLLFAELPAYSMSGSSIEEHIEATGTKADGVLAMAIRNLDDRPTEEFIGFNHRVGKRMAAHVAYADGHVDVVASPQSPSDTKLKNLTFLLCNGLDIPAKESEWASERSSNE